METQAIIPQPTGNPILDNPTLKAAFMAAQGGAQGGAQQPPQPQGAIMPPAGQQPPPQISLPDAPAPTPSPAKQPVVFGPFGQTSGPVAQRGTQEGDKQERERLLSTGSGLSQIHSRIESAMPNHPILGKVLGIGAQGLATLGDIGLSLTGPGQIAESMIPGTAGHHAAQLRQANQALTQDEANAEKEAQTSNLNIQPQLRQAQMALNQNKQSEVENHHQQQIESSLNEHGFTMGEDGKIAPLPYERMSEPQQAVHDLKASQEELANASAELKKAQAAGIPAQVAMAQQRIQTAQQNASTAVQRLGLTKEAMQFREQQATEKQDQPSSIAHGRADQGRAIVESANSLKRFIDTNPQVFGNLDSYWNKFVNDTPISDPMASKAMTELASFAALQPALHGMRSHDAMREFAKMIGGIPKNPESLKAAIDGIVDSAATPMINAGSTRHGGNQPAQGGAPQRPASVPAGYNFNPQGNGGKGSWQPPKQ